MMKSKTLWRPDEEADLIRLYRSGWLIAQLAEHIGRSPKAVETKVRTLTSEGRLTRRCDPIQSKAAKAVRPSGINHTPVPVPTAPRGYSPETAAWALANIRDDQEAGLIALHLAERGHAAAKAAIFGRAAA